MRQSSTIDISYHWPVPYASNSSISICPVLAQSLQSEDTVYSADSIEFSPVQQDVFVCGTYQIQKVEENKVVEEAQTTSEPNEESGEASNEDDMSDAGTKPAPKTTRLGRALVYRVADDGQSLSPSGAPGDHRLAIANAEGQIALHAWNTQTRNRLMFLSISYDEHIRLFDARNIKQPLRKVHVGGGVWRTKWHPVASRKSDVLLACMHGGFNIVNVGDALTAADACEHWSAGEDEGCTITTRFDKHESIAYGVDWSSQHLKNLGQKSVIASCSFYDHLLQLWHA
ncbi:hypothetical protein QFC24_000513 [Naganishia onofrii]|uniref:Uncharacterized protein n=1 Tax=Naganishia onofrii TaxID=1851511 RepID=A0ACC2XXH9_9TREE|nr:hypothetical protein QFC24_000513 [Naganishia onofrii]